MAEANKYTSVESLDTHCYLIRRALDISEQITLFEDIQRRDHRFTKRDQPKALYPSPRTVQLEENKNKIKFTSSDDPTIYSELVVQANKAITQTATPTIGLSEYKSITLSAIDYEAGKHSLADHVDHDDSFVYLLSIGSTTKFVAKGPNMAQKKMVQLQSGDMMVFDASTTGNILHGIASIEKGTCPEQLSTAFPNLRNHRYGIQLRVRF